MAFKRKAYSGNPIGKFKRYKPQGFTKYRKYKRMSKHPKAFASRVMRVVNQRAETKEVMRQLKNNQVLDHNDLVNLDGNAFECDIGVHGGNHALAVQRDGNKIFLKGLKIAVQIENQQYRPQASYWLYLVRLKGAAMDTLVTGKSQMFEGISTTIPMDYLDTAKCDVLFSKKLVVKAPNTGSSLALGGTVDGVADIDSAGSSYEVVSNGQTIQKFYVPINKTIQYRDSDDSALRMIPSSYRYQWVCASYSTFGTTTGGATYPVGHITMTQIMKFTDV